MPSDLIARYQRKFDREFPHGALASWQDPGNAVTYLVPRVLVTGQRGLDPEIWLPVFAGSDKALGPFRVLSTEEVQQGPHMVRLVLDGVDGELLLNAGVPGEAARAMNADRQGFIALAPSGGARVFDGDAPE
jgi:hypothetical protein